MRIALVYRHFNLGGSLPRSHVELARGLAERRHDVHVYSIRDTRDTSLAPGCTFHDVPVATVRPGEWSARELLSFAVNAARLVRTEPVDVVHTRLPGTWVADILHLAGVMQGEAARSGVPTARRLAGTLRRPGQLVRLAVEQRAIRSQRVSRLHVDSDLVLADLVRYYSVDPARVTIVPPGINLDDFKPVIEKGALRRDLGLPDPDFLILFCGHDFKRKGLDRAIAALARMSQPAHLVVVGGVAGGRQAEYEQLVATLGVADRVHFAGPRHDTHRFFQAADVFVLPTRVDMWGSTVVEAMATRIPPIVTDVAGSASIVEDGMSGFLLASPFDAGQLSALLDRLASDADLRVRVGETARERARGLDWKHHVDVVEAELLAVAKQAGGSATPAGSGSSS